MMYLFSCKQETEEVLAEDNNPISAEVLSKIKALGFSDYDVKKIIDPLTNQTGYIVEGDMFIGEDQLDAEINAQ